MENTQDGIQFLTTFGDEVQFLIPFGDLPFQINLSLKSDRLLLIGNKLAREQLKKEIWASAATRNLPLTTLTWSEDQSPASPMGLPLVELKSRPINLFEFPYLPHSKSMARDVSYSVYEEFVGTSLNALVLGLNLEKGREYSVNFISAVRGLLYQLSSKFFATPEIQQRYEAAIPAPMNSVERDLMPTGRDFQSFLRRRGDSMKSLLRPDFDLASADIDSAFDLILCRLDRWLTNLNFSFEIDEKSLSITLPANSESYESVEHQTAATVSAFGAVLQRSLSGSYVYHDPGNPVRSLIWLESGSLFNFHYTNQHFLRLLWRYAWELGISIVLACDNSCGISHRDYEFLRNNNSHHLIGNIEPAEVEKYVNLFRFPAKMIERNASPDFGFVPERAYSDWLIRSHFGYDYGVDCWRCRHDPKEF